MKRFKVLLPTMAVLFAIVAAFAFSPKSNARQEKALVDHYFIYTGNSLSDIDLLNPANWTPTTNPDGVSCGIEDVFPCIVKSTEVTDMDSDSDVDEDDFVAFLDDLETSSNGAASSYVNDILHKYRTRVTP